MRLVKKYSNGWVRYYGTKRRGKKRYRYNWYLRGFFRAWPRYLHIGRLFNRYAGYYQEYANNYRRAARHNQYWANRYDQYADQNQARAAELKADAQQYYAEAQALENQLVEIRDKLRDYQATVDTLQTNLDNLESDREGDMILWAATSMDAADRLSGQVYGNGVLTRHEYDRQTGRLERIHSEHGNTQLRDLRYEYNRNNSVIRQYDSVTGLDQSYHYDVKDQLTGMVQTQGDTTQSYSYGYDNFGNITDKSNVGTMAYDTGNRLVSLTRHDGTVVNYQYDANGNQLSGNGRDITWTVFNKAARIVDSSTVTNLHYGANHERVLQTVVQDNAAENTYYVGGGYEYVTDTRDASEKYRINLYAGKALVGTYIKTLSGGNRELDRLRYLHKDALGNVDMVTNIDGKIVARQSYSPFGMREQQKNGSLQAKQVTNYIQAEHQADVAGDKVGQAITMVSMEINRGFTGHEHLGNGLVNMNARLYDPETGRFLSADVYIQEPNRLLSHNRYIYVLNNPNKYTDPSGHFWNFIVGALISYVASQSDNPYIRTIGMIVGGAMMGGAFGGETLFANAALNKAAVGFTMGGIRGGDLESAVLGGLSAGLTSGIEHGANGGAFFGDNIFATAAAHGAAQGIIAEASGSDFKDGFRAGFALSILSQSAIKMREKMIAQSRKYSYIDFETGERIYPNLSGDSVGFRGDGVKLGGGRFNRYVDGRLLNPIDALRRQRESLLGGIQGQEGAIGWPKNGLGYQYSSGSVTDYIVEAYAGPHDYLNSPFFYNSMGNIRNMPVWLSTPLETVNLLNVVVATPFVLASITPADMAYQLSEEF